MALNTLYVSNVSKTKKTLSFQTLTEETLSREIYEDTHSLLREMLREMTVKVDAGLSFKFSPSEESMSKASTQLNLNYQYAKNSMIKEVSEYSTIEVNIRQ